MRQRCQNPNDASFDRYGGRGIKVCDRWNSLENFIEDMGERPRGMSLDRINNDGDYEPSNCRWATKLEQQANRSVTVSITANGATKPLTQWARELGAAPTTLFSRMAKGWLPEDVVTRPVRSKRAPAHKTTKGRS
jgi:hypothetical protein